jgi:type VI secretion system secreted protein VgrG
MGAEQILVHAERNLDVEVEGDETHTTNKTRTTLIKGHESATYESGEERHITRGAVETIDGGETRTVTGGATETVTEGETRTITGGATETITGGELRTVNDGIVETVNGNILLTVNGSSIRLVSGADIRITGAGRIELINAIDLKVVLGPDITLVAGPKIVYAPKIVNHTDNYTIDTTNYTLNADVVVIKTPHKTVNIKDQHWLLGFLKFLARDKVKAIAVAADVYDAKLQICGNNTQFNGIFQNWATFFMIDAPFKLLVGAKGKKEHGAVSLRFTPFYVANYLKVRKK